MASTLARKTGLTPQLGTRISTQKLDEWLQVTQSMIWKRWGKKWYLVLSIFHGFCLIPMDFMLYGILLTKTHNLFAKIIDSSLCSANSHLLAFGYEIKSSFRKCNHSCKGKAK